MFARKEKPLPTPVLRPVTPAERDEEPSGEGIHLGDGCYWNPSALPNGHIVAIGASGSGKTQTLKAIALYQSSVISHQSSGASLFTVDC